MISLNPRSKKIWFFIVIAIISITLSGCNKKSDKDKNNSEKENYGYENTDPSVGKFTLNGVTFEVPRKYIPFNRNKSSGEVDAFTLRYYFPNFYYEPELKRDNKAVHVLIKKCSSDKCKNISAINYQTSLLVRGGIKDGCLHGKGAPINGLHLKSYILNIGNNMEDESEILIEGDVCNPDYYLVCTTKNSSKSPTCQRWFYYKKNVIVNYAFSRIYLDNYASIEKKIINNLNNYIINDSK